MGSVNKKSDNKITKADLIGLFALLVLVVASFVGMSLKLNLPLSVLLSIVYVVAAVLIMWFAKWLKKTQSKPLLRVVELVSVIAFFVLVIAVLGDPVRKTASILWERKDDVVAAAREDVTRIDSLFDEYERCEAEYIAKMKTSLIGAVGIGSFDEQARTYLNLHQIQRPLSSSGIQKYIHIAEEMIYGKEYQDYKSEVEGIIASFESTIESMNIFTLPYDKLIFEDIYYEVPRKLSALSSTRHIDDEGRGYKFVIKPIPGSYTYTIDLDAVMEHEYEYDVVKSSFDEIMSHFRPGPLSYIFSVILSLLLLFPYIIAERCHTSQIKKHSGNRSAKSIGGVEL